MKSKVNWRTYLTGASASISIQGILYPMIAMVLAFLLSAVIMMMVGYNPIEAYAALWDGAFGSTNSLANTFSKSIPLMFTGLAVGFAMKGDMFNIGAEGQLHIGALTGTCVALFLPGLPKLLLIPLVLLGGFIGGMIWGGMIGAIKIKRGINEVIIAILTNYIAIYFTSYFVNGPLKAEGMVPQTEMISENARLSNIIPRTQLTSALYIAIILAVVIYFFFKKTRMGYHICAVGGNKTAAAAAGIPMVSTTIMTMALSGGIAALAGITEVMGKYGRFIDGFSPSFGFTGIAVAVLGRSNPFGIILTALLFGALDAGAMKMNRVAGISSTMVMTIQGLVILFVATPGIIRAITSIRKEKK